MDATCLPIIYEGEQALRTLSCIDHITAQRPGIGEMIGFRGRRRRMLRLSRQHMIYETAGTFQAVFGKTRLRSADLA